MIGRSKLAIIARGGSLPSFDAIPACARALRLLPALALAAALAGCGGVSTPGSSVPTILFSPIDSHSVYLMTLDGQELHEWRTDYPPGYSVSLLPNGMLLRANSIPERPLSRLLGSNGGQVAMIDWNGNPIWKFNYDTTEGEQHHDVFWMADTGHVLMVAWEVESTADAIAAGRDPKLVSSSGELWADKIVEVDPATNRIVWEWRTWDHLLPPGALPADHPGLIDINHVAGGTDLTDWTHANAVAYNHDLDQVMLSVRNFSEVWVIDHSTSTAEAAGHTGGRLGHGGDLIYRWGNPRAYGVNAPQQLFGQHSAHWIPHGLDGAGHILVFDNGDSALRPYSSVVELAPPVRPDGSYPYDPATGYGPAAPVWEYVADPPQSFFAPIISGAQRLASGNTFITVGTEGRFLEVTPDGQTVWSYTVTDTAGGTGYLVFRAVRYEPGYAGLAHVVLSPQGPLRIPVPTASSRATVSAY